MTNKDKILKKIKDVLKTHTFSEITTWVYPGMAEDLKTDDEIASVYSKIVPCVRCKFKTECKKETNMRGRCLIGPEDCHEFIANKLKEDKSND